MRTPRVLFAGWDKRQSAEALTVQFREGHHGHRQMYSNGRTDDELSFLPGYGRLFPTAAGLLSFGLAGSAQFIVAGMMAAGKLTENRNRRPLDVRSERNGACELDSGQFGRRDQGGIDRGSAAIRARLCAAGDVRGPIGHANRQPLMSMETDESGISAAMIPAGRERV